MTPRVRRIVIGLLVLAAVLWAAAESLTTIGAQRATTTRLRSELQDRNAQLTGVLRINAWLADSLRGVSAQLGQRAARADTIGRLAATIEAQADTIRRARATTLPLGDTTAHDSIVFLQASLVDADRESATLRQALELRHLELATRDSIDTIRREQLRVLLAANDSMTAQLRRVQPLLASADQALGHSEPRCRVARVVPCPSRTLAFVGGAVVTVVTYSALQQIH